VTNVSGPRDSGDIGRRVERRRRELGMSVRETAARAGMDPGYLEYVESQPAQLTYPALVRLAAALETTAAALTGAGVDRPPGEGSRARRRARLDTLTPEECRDLLGRGGVGRVVFIDVRGPVALPVNYRMRHNDVVFRTAAFSSLRGALYARRLTFEVDHIDEAMAEGWSVLVMGYAHEVRDADELREVQELGVEPWAGEERPVYIRIEPSSVSGRRIRSD
jgi:nitroimidazol reductase NimA-like FMN-containing flavoprotein (pyridoxamine 5'-phosphate oxidase superfamily)